MHRAMLLSADLGHYIADSYMPLHITRNYNGQFTGQNGVHSRYESDLIEDFQSQIIYDGDSLQYVDNLSDYVFNMIYDNYQYVDSVLYADAVAEAYAGNHNSTTYYNKFWEIAKNFTIGLFQKASYRIACVIYTEWINSGSVTSISENGKGIPSGFNLSQNYPNPFNPSTKIKFTIPEEGFVSIKIYSVLGDEVKTLVNEQKRPGTFEVTFDADQIPSGIYFYKFQTNSFTDTKKMVFLK